MLEFRSSFQVGLEEKELLQALQDEGFETTAGILKKLRLRLDLRRRTNSIEANNRLMRLHKQLRKS